MSLEDRRIWVGVAALVALSVVTAGAVSAVVFSNLYQYHGFAQVNKLILAPFDHIPNDGGPQIPISFLNGTTSSFNFSVLNRWKGSIDYNVSFFLAPSGFIVTNAFGVLVQYNVSSNGSLVDGPSFPIAWVSGPSYTVSGLTPTFTAVDLANDAGEQFFRADITLTFNLSGSNLDGSYTMDVALVSP